MLTEFFRFCAQNEARYFIETSRVSVTYGQFAKMVDDRVRHIKNVTQGRRCIIGFDSARSINSVISIVSIIEAGGIYFPTTNSEEDWEGVDPELFINHVDDFDCSIVPTKNYKISALPNGLDDCAYVLKTSGTTGSPKSVFCPLAGIERLVLDNGFLELRADDSILAMSPLTFDASTFEIWTAILGGIRLVIYDHNEVDLNLLMELINSHGIKILWLTSALFHLAIRHRVEMFANVRVVLAGGDVINPNAVNQMISAYPNLLFINGYGPTENTTFTACKQISYKDLPITSLPIGKLIKGTWGCVLDENNAEVPRGATGELVVGGKGLACKILVNGCDSGRIRPFPGQETLNCYWTGDLVYENECKELVFVGRVDNEVKRNGFRVNLTDLSNRISEVLELAPVHCFFENNNNTQQLIAVIPESPDFDAMDFFRKKLRRKLKKYEVPDMLVQVESFPISKNGKVDVNKLKESLSG